MYITPGNSLPVRYAVPPSMRARLPIPGGFDNIGAIYGYILLPPNETRGLIINVNDSCRSKSLFSYLLFAINGVINNLFVSQLKSCA